MYRVNDFQTSGVTDGQMRLGQPLDGAKDGANMVYTVPSGEKFIHTPPTLSMNLWFNGVWQALEDDYTVSESGGLGTGYDTVTFLNFAPLSFDGVDADYAVVA